MEEAGYSSEDKVDEEEEDMVEAETVIDKPLQGERKDYVPH